MAMYSSYFMQASRLSRYVKTSWNYIFMGDQIWLPKLVRGDRFWRRTDFFVTAQYKRRYHLAPPQNILTKQM